MVRTALECARARSDALAQRCVRSFAVEVLSQRRASLGATSAARAYFAELDQSITPADLEAVAQALCDPGSEDQLCAPRSASLFAALLELYANVARYTHFLPNFQVPPSLSAALHPPSHFSSVLARRAPLSPDAKRRLSTSARTFASFFFFS